MAIAYTPNPKFEVELAADQSTHDAILHFADTALAGAQAAAPVLTGRYRDSLSVESSGDSVGLISTSSLWGLIEFGSVHNPPFAPMQRGVEAAGLSFTDPGAP